MLDPTASLGYDIDRVAPHFPDVHVTSDRTQHYFVNPRK